MQASKRGLLMLPISLTIQGLYSYKTRQTIDFRSLTADHLFGIFGAVGSGKSSILDAITFALYGEVERVSKRDELNRNIFNRQAEEFLIDFQFESGADNELHRFVVKNSRKKNGEPQSFVRSAYVWKSDDWLPVDHPDASRIFNLSYDNFKRTVIIPQGRFQEFLQLGGKDRTEMLKELFPKVAEFDLQDKVAAKRKATDLEMAGLAASLNDLSEISEEAVVEAGRKISETEELLKTQEAEWKQAEQDFRKLEDLRLVFDELQKATHDLDLFEKEKSSQEQKRTELDRYESIFKAFDSDIKLLDKAGEIVAKTTEELNFTQKGVKKTEDLLQKSKAEYEVAKSDFERAPTWEKEAADWNLIRQILKLKEEQAAEEKELTGLRSRIQAGVEDLEAQKQSLQNSKDELEAAESQANDLPQMLEAEAYFKEKTRLQKDSADKAEKLKQVDEKLHQLKKEKDEALPEHVQKVLIGVTPDSKMSELMRLLAGAKTGLDVQIGELHAQKQELIKKEQLFNFSTQLAEGEACPLCGSVHHPDVISSEDVSVHQKENEKSIVQATQLLRDLGLAETKLSGLQAQLKGVMENQKAWATELLQAKTDLTELQDRHSNNPFVAILVDVLKAKLEAGRNLQTHVLQLKASVKKLEQEIATAELKLDAQKLQQNDLNQKLASSDGKMHGLQQQVALLKPEEWSHTNAASIDQIIEQTEVKIAQARTTLETRQAETQRLENQFTQWNTALQLHQAASEKATLELATQSEKLNEKIAISGLGDEAFIRLILSQNLDTVSLRKELESFFNHLLTTGERVRQLKEKFGNNAFSQADWQQAKEKAADLLVNFDREKGNLAVLKSDLVNLQQALEKQAVLREKINHLQLRQDNLSILYNLFRGQAFVNYASGVYLKNIVEQANQRFFRLTRQRLRLVLDGDNNFYVKDFLNGGHERLAKTLSGGQTFQASLSLALALADSVRYLTQSTRNFFFLDEGFGSLDKESLSLVFDTLRQLRHENRIVGIISHVEEMQQEIDTCLLVKLDEEKGSQLEVRL